MRNRLAATPMQVYRNRDYVMCELDDSTFDVWSELDIDRLATTGCLDAVSQLPTGSMSASHGYYVVSCIDRGMTLAEHENMMKLINDL